MKNLLVVIPILFCCFVCRAQNKWFAKVGIGYPIFTKEAKAVDINLGGYYAPSDYFYVGPHLNATIFKNKFLMNVGPELGTDAVRLTQHLLDETEGNLSGQVGVFFGFNLDKQNNLGKRFLFSKSMLTVGLSSTKVLNGHLFLGYDIAENYNIAELRKLSTVVLGSKY